MIMFSFVEVTKILPIRNRKRNRFNRKINLN